jgi:hypothetical protein
MKDVISAVVIATDIVALANLIRTPKLNERGVVAGALWATSLAFTICAIWQ